MKRPTVILFATLTPSLRWVAVAFAAMGREVYYINLAKALRNAQTQDDLYRRRVRQIDFAKLPGFAPYDIHNVHARISAALLNDLFPQDSWARVGALFPAVDHREGKLRAVFYEQIAAQLDPDAAVIAVGERLQKNGGKVLVWTASNRLTARLFGAHTALKTMVPTAIVGVGQLFAAVTARVVTRWRRPQGAPSLGRSATGAPERSATPPLDAEVLFFPHQGPAFGGLMSKDQYYAAAGDSAFAPERICHVELDDHVPNAIKPTVLSAYQDLGITPYFMKKAPQVLSKRELLRTVRLCMQGGLGFLAALTVARVRQRIVSTVAALSVFPKARVAVLGYEYLFPRWVAYTLQARGIRIAATQERLMQCFLPPWPLVLDTYFVQGDKARAAIAANPLACVDEIIVAGDVRAELMAPTHGQDGLFPAGFDHTTLVLDWHSDLDPLADRTKPTNSWANNRDFYEAVLRLAQAFPKNCFVIRGKNDTWLKVEALSAVRDQLQAQANVVINRDYTRHHISNALAAAADSIVARYTSLGDQALAAGKPVIYADWLVNGTSCIESICDFAPYPVIAHSCEELLSMYTTVVETGRIMDADLQQKMAREYAHRFPGALHPQDIVRDHLDAMLKQSRSAI